MQASVLPNLDIAPLNALLFDEHGNLKALPSAELRKIPFQYLQIFCAQHAIYTIPTQELIVYLKYLIKGRSAIEICAGHGAIGRLLGIPSTDSYCQQDTDFLKWYYQKLGQNPTAPQTDVLKFEALQAVKHFKPAVVIGSYVTQMWLSKRDTHASIYGVREDILFDRVKTYIKIGNLDVHSTMRLHKRAHEENNFPFLVTRSPIQGNNRIFIWNH